LPENQGPVAMAYRVGCHCEESDDVAIPGFEQTARHEGRTFSIRNGEQSIASSIEAESQGRSVA
ncbi:MAG: hypothetical protein J4N63_09235, partial [Chloroflexi bacterium]|nr:hypothetical protein [Chloroflexota bacterium]